MGRGLGYLGGGGGLLHLSRLFHGTKNLILIPSGKMDLTVRRSVSD